MKYNKKWKPMHYYRCLRDLNIYIYTYIYKNHKEQLRTIFMPTNWIIQKNWINNYYKQSTKTESGRSGRLCSSSREGFGRAREQQGSGSGGEASSVCCTKTPATSEREFLGGQVGHQEPKPGCPGWIQELLHAQLGGSDRCPPEWWVC